MGKRHVAHDKGRLDVESIGWNPGVGLAIAGTVASRAVTTVCQQPLIALPTMRLSRHIAMWFWNIIRDSRKKIGLVLYEG